MALTQASEGGLKISNAGTNGQYLQKQSGNTGGLTWATIDLSAATDYADNVKVRFGTGNDLEIYHDATNSRIQNTTGELIFKTGSNYVFYNSDGTEKHAKFNQNGGVELYYDNNKKFETSSSGVTLPDGLHLDNATNAGKDVQWQPSSDRLAFFDNVKATFGDGVDLQIFHDGTWSYVRATNGNLAIQSKAGENSVVCIPDGKTSLYYDNSEKFQTANTGAKWTGDLFCDDDNHIKLGDSGEFQIYHHSNGNSFLKESGSGSLVVLAEDFYVQKLDTTTLLKVGENDDVQIYHNGNRKIHTTSGGVDVTGVMQCDEFKLLDGEHAKFGTGEDLRIYHDGSHSIIKNSTGSLYAATGAFLVQNAAQTESQIISSENGAVELYYDNAKKFETDSGGIKVFGNIYGGDSTEVRLGDSGDLQLFHNASTGEGRLYNSNAGGLVLVSNLIKLRNQNNNESMLQATADGAVELYYDNQLRFKTSAGGCILSSHEGSDNAVEIWCDDGDDNADKWRFNLYASSNQFHIQNYAGSAWEDSIVMFPNGAVKLYKDNSLKAETTSAGFKVHGGFDHDGHTVGRIWSWCSASTSGSGSVSGSHNISSVSEPNGSRVQFNFDTDMPNTNYGVCVNTTFETNQWADTLNTGYCQLGIGGTFSAQQCHMIATR